MDVGEFSTRRHGGYLRAAAHCGRRALSTRGLPRGNAGAAADALQDGRAGALGGTNFARPVAIL